MAKTLGDRCGGSGLGDLGPIERLSKINLNQKVYGSPGGKHYQISEPRHAGPTWGYQEQPLVIMIQKLGYHFSHRSATEGKA